MNIVEILKVVVLGIVEGFTEWLPVSSTGHMILVNEIIKLRQPESYYSVFEVVIQLGAILAVVTTFFQKLWPFARTERGGIGIVPDKFALWVKIIVACLPAAVLGLLLDDFLDKYLYNGFVVALTLIGYGVAFLWIERRNEVSSFRILRTGELDFKTAFLIGCFQCLALIPGTSRSGSTILGAMLMGVSRTPATEFSFFLSVPVMFGASLLKLIKAGFAFNAVQWVYLIMGMVIAYVVSLYCINFLMQYIRRHDFRIFGWYRIVLGIIVLLWFAVRMLLGTA